MDAATNAGTGDDVALPSRGVDRGVVDEDGRIRNRGICPPAAATPLPVYKRKNDGGSPAVVFRWGVAPSSVVPDVTDRDGESIAVTARLRGCGLCHASKLCSSV